MAQLLNEIGLCADRPLRPDGAAVENMSRVVCSLLVQGLQKRVSPPFWKLSIRINAQDRSEDNKILIGVFIANRAFPTNEFIGWTLENRQSYMLQFVSTTLRETLINQQIDVSAVDDAAKYVVDRKFLNVIVGKKRFANPDGLEVAHIECEQEMDEARIYVVFTPKVGPLRRVLVATTVPEEFIFQSFFGRVEWGALPHPSLTQGDGTILPINDVRKTGRSS